MKVQEDKQCCSVICLTKGSDSLYFVLWSLKHQIISTNFETIIVFEGDDKTRAKIVFFAESLNFLNLKLIQNCGQGISNGRNIGSSAAESEILIFIDDDAFLSKFFIQSHVNHHLINENSIGVGEKFQFILTNKDKLVRARYLIGIFNHIEKYFDRVTTDWYEKSVADVLKFSKLKSISWYACVGRNLSLSRTCFNRLQGFDTNFKKWGCEDIEFGFRAWTSGMTIDRVENAANYHILHPICKENLQQLNDNLFYFERKYPYDLSVSLYRLFTFGRLGFEEIIDLTKKHAKEKVDYFLFMH